MTCLENEFGKREVSTLRLQYAPSCGTSSTYLRLSNSINKPRRMSTSRLQLAGDKGLMATLLCWLTGILRTWGPRADVVYLLSIEAALERYYIVYTLSRCSNERHPGNVRCAMTIYEPSVTYQNFAVKFLESRVSHSHNSLLESIMAPWPITVIILLRCHNNHVNRIRNVSFH